MEEKHYPSNTDHAITFISLEDFEIKIDNAACHRNLSTFVKEVVPALVEDCLKHKNFPSFVIASSIVKMSCARLLHYYKIETRGRDPLQHLMNSSNVPSEDKKHILRAAALAASAGVKVAPAENRKKAIESLTKVTEHLWVLEPLSLATCLSHLELLHFIQILPETERQKYNHTFDAAQQRFISLIDMRLKDNCSFQQLGEVLGTNAEALLPTIKLLSQQNEFDEAFPYLFLLAAYQGSQENTQGFSELLEKCKANIPNNKRHHDWDTYQQRIVYLTNCVINVKQLCINLERSLQSLENGSENISNDVNDILLTVAQLKQWHETPRTWEEHRHITKKLQTITGPYRKVLAKFPPENEDIQWLKGFGPKESAKEPEKQKQVIKNNPLNQGAEEESSDLEIISQWLTKAQNFLQERNYPVGIECLQKGVALLSQSFPLSPLTFNAHNALARHCDQYSQMLSPENIQTARYYDLLARKTREKNYDMALRAIESSHKVSISDAMPLLECAYLYGDEIAKIKASVYLLLSDQMLGRKSAQQIADHLLGKLKELEKVCNDPGRPQQKQNELRKAIEEVLPIVETELLPSLDLTAKMKASFYLVLVKVKIGLTSQENIADWLLGTFQELEKVCHNPGYSQREKNELREAIEEIFPIIRSEILPSLEFGKYMDINKHYRVILGQQTHFAPAPGVGTDTTVPGLPPAPQSAKRKFTEQAPPSARPHPEETPSFVKRVRPTPPTQDTGYIPPPHSRMHQEHTPLPSHIPPFASVPLPNSLTSRHLSGQREEIPSHDTGIPMQQNLISFTTQYPPGYYPASAQESYRCISPVQVTINILPLAPVPQRQWTHLFPPQDTQHPFNQNPSGRGV